MSTQAEIDAQVAAFLAQGGRVQHINEGRRAVSEKAIHVATDANDAEVADYTDWRMRQAENQTATRNAYFR